MRERLRERGRFIADSPFIGMKSIIEHHQVAPEPNSGCWLWYGNRTRKGYGLVKFRGGHMVTHRVSLALIGVEVPRGKIVCHKCDTPECVNPDHLYVGTYSDNMRDAKPKLDLRFDGEKHWNHKLKEWQVREILSLPRPVKYREVAARYGVSQYCISDIITGRSWSHLHA